MPTTFRRDDCDLCESLVGCSYACVPELSATDRVEAIAATKTLCDALSHLRDPCSPGDAREKLLEVINAGTLPEWMADDFRRMCGD
jgi:hypothetical protein